MGHEWTKKAVEQPMYSMRDMEVAENRMRAEVLAACIHATCVLCRTGEKPHLQSFGGKNWEGRYQAWVHDVKIEGHVEVQTCPADAMHSLQPAAKALEEFEKKVQHESYGAARILWIAGICGLLKIPKPKPDESGLEWLNKEGGRALEELLRDERLVVLNDAIRLLRRREGHHDAWVEPIRLLQAELEKARARKENKA